MFTLWCDNNFENFFGLLSNLEELLSFEKMNFASEAQTSQA